MDLSLDDVVIDIYDAYKITEDEQIKQGILKTRVNYKDFSSSLKDQLKGLSDDELVAVTGVLKNTFKDSNINDFISNNNGTVSFSIPQDIIKQGIALSKELNKGVSGVSLEHPNPIVEQVIETAGVLGLAGMIQEYIKPEQLTDLFGRNKFRSCSNDC